MAEKGCYLWCSAPAMLRILNYINGKLQEPVGGNYLPNLQPATGSVYSMVAASDDADIELAVQAAQHAFAQWAATPAMERCRLLLRIADRIEERLDELAAMESADQGKPIRLARQVDIPRASANFRFFATAAVQFASEAHIMENGAVNYTLRQPLGVVGCISPWNLPLYLFTWKIAPALAAGNCVVGKPSEFTPLTAYELGRICMEVGLPPGVLNIVHGSGPQCGMALVKHPRVKAISFTGSTRAGREIAAAAAPQFKKLSLELGGKNPVLVFADCDFDTMLERTVASAFENQGEICLCGSRIYIEQSIYEKFREAFVDRVRRLRVGNPADPATDLGAIVSRQHYEKILGYLALVRQEGGRILCGGHPVHPDESLRNGWYIAPTVVEGLPQHCRINQEEIFGPIVSIQPFDSEQQALQLANDSAYGLAAVLWTQNLSRAQRLAQRLEAGIVWVNCWMVRDLRTPFGGVKQSGMGREGGWEAMRFFTEPKNVCILPGS